MKTALDIEQRIVARVDSLDKEVHGDVSQLREAVAALDGRISSLPGSRVLDQLTASVSGLEEGPEAHQASLARIFGQIASLEALLATQEASFDARRSHRCSPHRAHSCGSEGKETGSNASRENRRRGPGPPSITVVGDAAQSADSDDDASR